MTLNSLNRTLDLFHPQSNVLKGGARSIFSTIALALISVSCQTEQPLATIDLSGPWTVKLDSLDKGEPGNWYGSAINGQEISLPSTLDEAGIGIPNKLEPALDNYVLAHLTRKHSYTGKAWYQRKVSIPASWEGKKIEMKLERVLWQSQVWVNDKKVDAVQESLITPHYFDLSEFLSPGAHTLTILVDNSNFYPGINVDGRKYPAPEDGDLMHGYSNHTQIKWNGILGEISLTAKPSVAVEDIQVYLQDDQIQVKTSLSQDFEGNAEISVLDGEKTIISKSAPINGKMLSLDISAGHLTKWDEFNPQVYQCRVSIPGHSKTVDFGVRKISNENATLAVNDQRVFMRGNLECSIFPLTGRPPMEKEGWRSLMDTAKAYGLNHLRFHSWCPPKAAFEVADELGIYLQVELPFWNLAVGSDEKTNDFLYREAKSLLREYGNHPSFVFFSSGNELEGDTLWLNELIANMKQWDDRHLYMTTTFSFQQGVGDRPQPEDEYFVTQWTDRGWVRGQGVFNQYPPNFSKTYTENMGHIRTPLISHEIGQYSVFPDLSEIPKYTGVLQPLNFEAVKQDLEKKGLVHLAPAFTQASGKLAALLYKEEIERTMRTPGFDGFQLLQLQDFPGQGTALVGLLNAFWESKGAITAPGFREFCAPVVPLLSFEKAVYRSGENFNAQIQVANFKEPIENYSIRWTINDGNQNVHVGDIKGSSIPIGNEHVVGEINTTLEVEKATQLEVQVEIQGTPYKNRWKIWVYPRIEETQSNVIYTRSFTSAKKALDEGKKVLLNPDFKQLKGVTGRFVPVFWSPVHFPDQPSTMGILCDPAHPAWADFPTESHTNWQWWDLNINSKALILDDLAIDPIVRVIDNFVTNRSLGNIFEAKVGEGKLLLTSIDLANDLENRIVARQMKNSLMAYMNGPDFNPSQEVDFSKIETLAK